MKVFDGGRDSLHAGLGLPFGEKLLPQDLVEEFSAAHQLEDEEDVVLVLERVAEADDVRVRAVPQQDLDLLTAIPLAFINNLQSKIRMSITFKKYSDEKCIFKIKSIC